jgi:hypothetical protein
MQTQVTVNETTKDTDPVTGIVTETNSIETHKTRALQGASKWLINSDLKYQFTINKNWSNTVSLVYSVFGKRIFAVGTGGLDHLYELPINQLDLVWSSKLSKKIDLKFSSSNLLNPKRQTELGNDGKSIIDEPSNTTISYKKGIGFSASLSYTF